jgi:small neutral amino acid transporter SnatA (MarC family)
VLTLPYLIGPGALFAGLTLAARAAPNSLRSSLFLLLNLAALGCFLLMLGSVMREMADDLDPGRCGRRI